MFRLLELLTKKPNSKKMIDINFIKRIKVTEGLMEYMFINHNYPVKEDIRNLTIDKFLIDLQTYRNCLILSENLNSIEFIKKNIHDGYEKEDIDTLVLNQDGFLKDALLMRFFINFEDYFRTIAIFYEESENELNKNSILETIKKVIKIDFLDAEISIKEKDILTFLCYLRNTQHSYGFQNRENYVIEIEDRDSVLIKEKIALKLLKDEPNNFKFEELIFLLEQIFKVIIKINKLLPEEDFIPHTLCKTGYNG